MAACLHGDAHNVIKSHCTGLGASQVQYIAHIKAAS